MQLDMFDVLLPTFRFEKDKAIRVVELFSGIGFQAMGIELAEIPYEVVATSEIDKYAIASYEAIHGHNPNLGSITDIEGKDIPNKVDVMTYSFPCTDLSKAGKQKGLDNTRSGLVYEVLRLLQQMKELDNLPKVLIMENVVDLVQQKFINQFSEIQQELESLGYTNYTQTLNAKNYGIAQNRDRVFMVSILGEYNYNFPKPFELTTKLKDYLEDEVDEKYYLSEKMLACFTDMKDRNGYIRGKRFNPHSLESPYGYTVTTRAGGRATDNFIAIPEATKQGYAVAKEGDGVYTNRPHQKRGVVQSGMIQTIKTSSNDIGVVVKNKKQELVDKMLENGHLGLFDVVNHSYSSDRSQRIDRIENKDGLSPTLTTRPDTLGVVVGSADGIYTGASKRFQRGPLDGLSRTLKAGLHDSGVVINKLAIRKLTPRETGRLMGMNDEQIDKQLEVVSNAQAYKQHGNGIVAQVIGLIIGMMYYGNENELREIVMKNSYIQHKEKEKI